jgi:hypothetical protein
MLLGDAFDIAVKPTVHVLDPLLQAGRNRRMQSGAAEQPPSNPEESQRMEEVAEERFELMLCGIPECFLLGATSRQLKRQLSE